MKRILIALMILAGFVLAGPLAAQEDPSTGGGAAGARQQRNEPPTFSADEVRMHYFRPRFMHAGHLLNVIRDIYGRDIYVDGLGGSRGGRIHNLFTVEDTIVIYDTDDYALTAIAAMRDLEAEFKKDDEVNADDDGDNLVMFEYTPRYLTLSSIASGLRPLTRQIMSFSPNSQNRAPQQNVSFIEQPPMIIVRDTQKQVSEIHHLLGRIDVPAPQVLITCWVIEGTDEAIESGNVPSEVVQSLRLLLPYPGYRQKAVGMVRTSVNANDGIRLSLSVSNSAQSYDLNIQPGAYDRKDKSFQLAECTFQLRSQNMAKTLFSTSTTVHEGEYSVLGVTGDNPLYVVLRVTPVK